MSTPAPYSPVTLIVGVDGIVGSALAARLGDEGVSVTGTSRRRDRVGPATTLLDLTDDPASWAIPAGVGTAVVCAGVADAGRCREDPEGTARINVEGTVALVERLVADGVFVTWLSGDHVYGSVKSRYTGDEPTAPATEYGRQKAEAERRLSALGDSVAIVRCTKILAPGDALFAAWRRSLIAGEPVRPFSDMYVAPVPLGTAVDVLTRVSQGRLPGLWQVSGDRAVSYGEAARIGAKALGADAALVQPVAAAEAGYTEPPRPPVVLATQRIEQELGVRVPDVGDTLRNVFMGDRAPE